MKLYQSDFEKSPTGHQVRSQPLSIHAREHSECKQVIVFVHGLNGERYETWGDLPNRFSELFSVSDFGFYGYTNGFARWNPFTSISIEDEAQVLIDTLRDSPYEKIVLLGHSLGGVLIRVAVAKMVEMNQSDLLRRLAAAFLFATPQLGAHSMPRVISALNSDATALRRNDPLIRRTTRIFLDNFYVGEEPPNSPNKFWLPVYCVQAAEDFWVTELSSTLNISSDMRKVVRNSHTGLVKGTTSEVSDWVTTKLMPFIDSPTPEFRPREKMIRLGPKSPQ